jgi:hypothetical protein
VGFIKDSTTMTMNIVKFPYRPRVNARGPRRSKNGTPEERAAKAAAAPPTAAVLEISRGRAEPTLETIDPIFAAIDAHRKANAAHEAACEELQRLERVQGATAAWANLNGMTEKPCHDENDAFAALVAAPSTTMPGLIAKLAYLQDLAHELETAWMFEDRQEIALALIESFAVSISNLSVQP